METTCQTPLNQATGRLSVELLDVVSILKSKLDIQALYCFGIRQNKKFQMSFLENNSSQDIQTIHLDLLVLSTEIPHNATADLGDLIYRQTGGRYCVTLLLHKPAQVRASTFKNGYLFKNILKSGWLLTAQPAPFELPAFTLEHHLNVEQVKKFTSNRLYNAHKLFEIESAVQGVEGGLLRASLLHCGVEQLCLAIIYAYMGYYPNHFNLRYLFALCSHYTPLTNELFPDETKEDKMLMNILHTTTQSLRFKKSEQFNQVQLQVLEERCLNFYTKTEQLIENRIAVLNQNEPETMNNE